MSIEPSPPTAPTLLQAAKAYVRAKQAAGALPLSGTTSVPTPEARAVLEAERAAYLELVAALAATPPPPAPGFDALRQAAVGATSGPLSMYRYNHGGGRMFREYDDERGPDLIADFYDIGNREYYAAAHPAAVLSLLAALDAARAENERLQEFADRIKHDAGENLRARNRAEAEAERQRAGYASLSRLIEPHHKGATGRDMTADEIAQFIVDCCKRIDDLGDELAELKQQLAASTELLQLREAQLVEELNRDDDALRQRNAALVAALRGLLAGIGPSSSTAGSGSRVIVAGYFYVDAVDAARKALAAAGETHE